MFFVLALALAGLFLIYLEFFLPAGVMAIGGTILLFSSILFFHMAKPSLLSLVLYLTALGLAVYYLVRFALWRVRKSEKKELPEKKDQ
jgi:membrane-bound ClpP family serine protease